MYIWILTLANFLPENPPNLNCSTRIYPEMLRVCTCLCDFKLKYNNERLILVYLLHTLWFNLILMERKSPVSMVLSHMLSQCTLYTRIKRVEFLGTPPSDVHSYRRWQRMCVCQRVSVRYACIHLESIEQAMKTSFDTFLRMRNLCDLNSWNNRHKCAHILHV